MGKPTLKAYHIEQAVKLLSDGHSQQAVGDAIGYSRVTINKLAQNYKQEIEERTIAMLSQTLPLVCANQYQVIWLANTILAAVDKPTDAAQIVKSNLDTLGIEAGEILALADKKENRLLQIAGMAPSHTQSVIINNILNANNNSTTLSADTEAVRAWLDLKRKRDLEQDAIDAPIEAQHQTLDGDGHDPLD